MRLSCKTTKKKKIKISKISFPKHRVGAMKTTSFNDCICNMCSIGQIIPVRKHPGNYYEIKNAGKV